MPQTEGRQLAHMVFFTLEDASGAARQRLLQSCRELLSNHPGSVDFSVGERAAEFARPVNDDAFDVALHVVFASRDAHDAYQQSERHQRFIAENKPNWKQLRVFDSYV